jgi:hypothetical protein
VQHEGGCCCRQCSPLVLVATQAQIGSELHDRVERVSAVEHALTGDRDKHL